MPFVDVIDLRAHRAYHIWMANVVVWFFDHSKLTAFSTIYAMHALHIWIAHQSEWINRTRAPFGMNGKVFLHKERIYYWRDSSVGGFLFVDVKDFLFKKIQKSSHVCWSLLGEFPIEQWIHQLVHGRWGFCGSSVLCISIRVRIVCTSFCPQTHSNNTNNNNSNNNKKCMDCKACTSVRVVRHQSIAWNMTANVQLEQGICHKSARSYPIRLARQSLICITSSLWRCVVVCRRVSLSPSPPPPPPGVLSWDFCSAAQTTHIDCKMWWDSTQDIAIRTNPVAHPTNSSLISIEDLYSTESTTFFFLRSICILWIYIFRIINKNVVVVIVVGCNHSVAAIFSFREQSFCLWQLSASLAIVEDCIAWKMCSETCSTAIFAFWLCVFCVLCAV